MDDIVRQAMAKWPQVPDCYGWLALDARGDWYLRDAAAQARGSFASGHAGARGSRLQHAALRAFIERNYASDSAGQWYFQNGPQRVYVELEATPWVWRITQGLEVLAHDGQATAEPQCYCDERGWVYLKTARGFGVVHSQDVVLAERALTQGRWTLQQVLRASLPERFAYVTSPQALHARKPA